MQWVTRRFVSCSLLGVVNLLAAETRAGGSRGKSATDEIVTCFVKVTFFHRIKRTTMSSAAQLDADGWHRRFQYEEAQAQRDRASFDAQRRKDERDQRRRAEEIADQQRTAYLDSLSPAQRTVSDRVDTRVRRRDTRVAMVLHLILFVVLYFFVGSPPAFFSAAFLCGLLFLVVGMWVLGRIACSGRSSAGRSSTRDNRETNGRGCCVKFLMCLKDSRWIHNRFVGNVFTLGGILMMTGIFPRGGVLLAMFNAEDGWTQIQSHMTGVISAMKNFVSGFSSARPSSWEAEEANMVRK